jgi:hypothetical protein
MFTLDDVHNRYNALIGEDVTLADDTAGVSHINAAIRDILNRYPFSWARTTENLTLATGVDGLASTYNPKWRIEDARVTGSEQGDDLIFTEIQVADRDKYTTDDYVYWLSYYSTTPCYNFNSLTQTGTVTVYYQYLPAALSGPTNKCIVPDIEAVAYLAAAKNWISDERNIQLAPIFSQEADKRIKDMYVQDMNFGPMDVPGSILDDNDL